MISLQRFNNSAVDEEDIMQPNNYVNTLIKKKLTRERCVFVGYSYGTSNLVHDDV